MLRLASSIAALSVLAIGTASADMIAGVFHCSGSQSELVWQGAAPAGVLLERSRCGFRAGQACTTSLAELLTLVEKRGCKGAISGTSLGFVCTGDSNRLENVAGDLCKAVIP